MLDEILDRINNLGDDGKAVVQQVLDATKDQVWFPNPGPQTEAYFCEADELFYGGCVSGDTEFLTPSGWKRIDQYQDGDLVAQWDIDSQMRFVRPLGYTNAPCEGMWRFKSRRLDMLLSDEHRVPLYQYDRTFKVKRAADLAEHPSRHWIPVSFSPPSNGLDMNDDMIRLGVAIHADGSFDGATDDYCRISLRKDRKKARLKSLLSRLGIEWKEYRNDKRPTEVRYSFTSPIKSKTYEGWWAATPHQIKIILNEMPHWDGHYSGATGGDICFSTTVEGDADFMQYCAHATGLFASIGVAKHDEPQIKDLYRVHIQRKPIGLGVMLRNREGDKGTEITREDVGRKYCFRTPSSYWIARRNNLIFVTGNSAGGGKSSLLVGLSQTCHEKSLILRRYRDDAKSLAEDELINTIYDGNRDGWNGADLVYRTKGHVTTFGGCMTEDDKQRYKGKPHDLKGFDEVSDFTENQYMFIIGWNRTTTPGQRCRVVATGNPPTTAEGLWIIRRWAAWLDPKHPNPAKPGELRWYIRDDEGMEIEVEGRGPHMIGDVEVLAKSRTFIRAKLEDNPDLAEDGSYEAMLSQLPKELRDAYRDGKFDVALKDDPWQMIPTAWVMAAQARWTKKAPEGVPMCAIGVDVAQGGDDNNIIAKRHDHWFDELEVIPGKLTPLGTDVAGVVMARRRDHAKIVLDCGGGYGGSAYKHFKDNDVPCTAYKGTMGTKLRSKNDKIGFANVRTLAYWRLREALDPDQPGGSDIALPDDPELLADLTSPTYEVRNNTYVMEAKDKLIKRIGRSPDRGDAVVMAWFDGATVSNQQGGWKNREPKVILRTTRRQL